MKENENHCEVENRYFEIYKVENAHFESVKL